MDVKTPEFDTPLALGSVAEGKPLVDPTKTPVEVGDKVLLVYRGKHMNVEVIGVEEPNAQFIGRVIGFEQEQLKHGDLRHGDAVRFLRPDIRIISCEGDVSSRL